MKARVLIAGGGTGGHIYPAIAIGQSIQKNFLKFKSNRPNNRSNNKSDNQLNNQLAKLNLFSDLEVSYVGTSAGLEQKIMAREKLKLDLIKSGKLNFTGNPLQKIKTLLQLPIGLLQSFILLRKYQPVFVLGVGGYASAPFLLMASLMGYKTALWEPNAHSGMANRLLSRFVPKAYLVFEDAKKYLKCKHYKVFGMPLREEIENIQKLEFSDLIKLKTQQLVEEKINHPKLTILCFGGSQGSLFLNKAISDFVLAHPELHNDIQFVHQTGQLGYEEMKLKYNNLSCVELHEFIYDMPSYYKKADVQFCRGGASTIAEAASFAVVPIIIPLKAADNHQLKNAQAVVHAKAGFLIEQDQFSQDEFYNIILKLKNDESLRQSMASQLKKMAPQQASLKIAEDILQEIFET